MKSRIGSSTIVLEALPGAPAMPDEFARVPDLESRHQELVLRQRKGLFTPWRQLVLFNEHYVEFRDGAGRARPRVVNLAFLADQPAIVSGFPWRWLVVSLLLLGAASVAALFLNGCYSQPLRSLLLSVCLFILLGPSSVCCSGPDTAAWWYSTYFTVSGNAAGQRLSRNW